MELSASTLKKIVPGKVIIPDEHLFKLPEKVLQFGTGILLRGLPDYFIDKANRMGMFNGRIVIVKTTSKGDASAFDKQDCLYTLCIRGVANNKKIEENIINSSISRVLNAQHEWKQILECAYNESLQVIISNTTEVGIKLINDNIKSDPPDSYPGKLLAFLVERFIAFNGSEKSGFVIVPTELIPDNGKKLESIILELAHLNGLDDSFITWLQRCNFFCNSLVDRIVTGMPDIEIKNTIEKELGYADALINICEVYRLWAIEGSDYIKNILSFAAADEGVIIAPDIDLYRELKLRLLNGTHTLSCGIAFLARLDTVKLAMDDKIMEKYIADLMQYEIGTSIPYKIDSDTVQSFIRKVLDRFRNPHINHYWKTITLNYSSKMRLRCIPLLLNYYQREKKIPRLFALGFAAYIFFMKPVKQDDNRFYGNFNNTFYLIEDETAGIFYELWQKYSGATLVGEVLSNKELWGQDLRIIPRLWGSIESKLTHIINYGMTTTLKNYLS